MFPKLAIHAGFYDAYLCFKPRIIEFLKSKDVEGYPLVITGHSLGGALATIAAFDLTHMHEKQVHSVWTYGEPRNGNSIFSERYAKIIPTHWRHTHRRDIVPHVPLQMQGYYHVAREVFFFPEVYTGEYRICDGSGEDGNCSNSETLPVSIHDHLHYLNISLGQAGCDWP
eukprot:CAMPEP_0167758408 /NCGR_PEP_ID=MMETSP0110_2-20121227/10451_1 /TAXON_ID=629695 /ORGANISM="Gymnochlora sp., Strain CCMP2014" /LENGTH=169 /DNA_ID=CAMNT_0007644679 /DNA_START=478 /DNA_END=987 /DNA_ORIENTATION=-